MLPPVNNASSVLFTGKNNGNWEYIQTDEEVKDINCARQRGKYKCSYFVNVNLSLAVQLESRVRCRAFMSDWMFLNKAGIQGDSRGDGNTSGIRIHWLKTKKSYH